MYSLSPLMALNHIVYIWVFFIYFKRIFYFREDRKFVDLIIIGSITLVTIYVVVLSSEAFRNNILLRQFFQYFIYFVVLRYLVKDKSSTIIVALLIHLCVLVMCESFMFPFGVMLAKFQPTLYSSQEYFQPLTLLFYDILMFSSAVAVPKYVKMVRLDDMSLRMKCSISSIVVMEYLLFLVIVAQYVDVTKLSYIIYVGMVIFTVIGYIILFLLANSMIKQQRLEKEKEMLILLEEELNLKCNNLIKKQKDIYYLETLIKEALLTFNAEEKLVEDVEKEYRQLRVFDYSSNPIVNVILKVFQENMQQEEIDIEYHIKGTVPDYLQDLEIVKIFSNILKNALEASCNSLEKKVSLSTDERHGLFLIECINSKGEKNFVKEKLVRGEGLSILKEVINKYCGEMLIEDKDVEFRIRIMLPQEFSCKK